MILSATCLTFSAATISRFSRSMMGLGVLTGSEGADPEVIKRRGQPGLGEGRHVRHQRQPFGRTDRQHADLAVLLQRKCVQRGRRIHVEATGNQLVHALRRAAERHVGRREAGGEAEALHEQLPGGADAGGAVEDVAARRLAGVHEVLENFVLGGGRDHERNARERRDRGEIVRHAVRQFGEGRCHDDVRGRIHQQRVAVRVGLGHHVRAERGAGSAAVLDDETLSNLSAHLIEYRACHDVGRAAGGKRHDDLDGLFGRPIIRSCRERSEQQGKRRPARRPRDR